MQQSTDNLDLPYILPSQAQKHVTHNEALRVLDALVQPGVAGIATIPPDEPQPGLRVIVGPGSAGTFAGHDHAIAAWGAEGWRFYRPQRGWTAYDAGQKAMLGFDGEGWMRIASERIEQLGIGTEADAENRLTVESANTLFTHDESGSHRLKVNKAGLGDTATLLFQSGYSGRAEMGLSGDDNFAIKVSADGATWREAMTVNAASGHVRFPAGGVREQLTAPRTYFVATTGSDGNDGLSAASPFATLQKAVDAALALDAVGHQVTIQIADGIYLAATTVSRPLFDGGMLIIRGNAAQPHNVQLGAAGLNALSVEGAGVFVRLEGVSLSGQVGLWARFGAVVHVRARNVFDACSARHIGVDNGAYVEIIGQTEITGSSPFHLYANQNGHILMTGSTVTLTGSPHFSSAFCVAQLTGLLSAYANSYAGTATGSRYRASGNGVINVNGAGETALPGSAPGTVASGGQYF